MCYLNLHGLTMLYSAVISVQYHRRSPFKPLIDILDYRPFLPILTMFSLIVGAKSDTASYRCARKILDFLNAYFA